MSKVHLKEPYLANIAICLEAQAALGGLRDACEKLSHLVDTAKRAHTAIAQMHEDWINWLEDPTQETLQPVLADLHDLKLLQPQLHLEVLSFYEPADVHISSYLEGGTTLGEVHGAFMALRNDPDQMPEWCRGVSEASTLEMTALQGIVGSSYPALATLYGLADMTFRVSTVQSVV